MTKPTTPWWKAATGYQIYPRSFCDSNGDGIGDIPGIISKLDHLRDLGDFDRLVAQAKARGIRIVMDLVVNHCSSDHVWFQKACETTDCPEHDYFYWRAPNPDGSPPDDQRACFGGPAWIWVEAVGKYYLGFYGEQQPEDVDGRHYFEGPDMHRFIQEMYVKTLQGRDIMTVGEAWSVTPDTALDYCGANRAELDMVFNFNHIQAAWDPIKGRFGPNLFDLVTHKSILNEWQAALAHDGWNSLYLSNHDLPRPVSQYADDGLHRRRSAKMLAMAMYLMKGTPFIYQGEEIGMTNVVYERMDQFRDIETFGQYRDQIAAGVSEADFLEGANKHGRDNARTPMHWDAGPHAGFTTGVPWIDVNLNFDQINVAQDRKDAQGVFAFYQRLIALRKNNLTIQDGRYLPLEENHPNIVAYTRARAGEVIHVLCNFSADVARMKRPDGLNAGAEVLLSNTQTQVEISDWMEFAPYQAVAFIQTADGA